MTATEPTEATMKLFSRAGALPTLLLAAILTLTACGAVESVVDDRSAGQVLDDNVIYTKISTGLVRESADLYLDVSTSVFQGRVMLTGSVPNRDSLDTSARVANAVAGVTEVINELQITEEGGFKSTAKDLAIEAKLEAKLIGATNIKQSNYRWKSVHGIVYLLGLAQDQAELNRVLTVIKDTDGVDRVITHVKLIA